jgi:asparagine synthase (glutamine-hydrolysing)
MPYDTVERHAVWMGSFSPAEQRDLFTSDALAAMGRPPAYEHFHEVAARAQRGGWLDRLLYLDLKGYLGEGVLAKVDRASMACSLEVRVPLLDRRVVELAASLPADLKLRGLTTKYILKRALRGVVPASVLARRKKGFGVPLARWFREDLEPLLRDVCSTESIRRAGLFRPEAVERLLVEHRDGRRDHRKKLYTLLAWQLWGARWGVA